MVTLSEVLKRVSDTAEFAHAPAVSANHSGLFGNFPLHVAACWGDCEAISVLAHAGTNVDQRGEHGFSPLMEAVAQGHRDAALPLISLGATAVRNDDGQLPSQYALMDGDAELSALLAQHGC